jgi:hypothetical protein
MTTRKAAENDDVAAAQAGNAEVQKQADEDNAKGYRGQTFDPHPNSAYSIATGPDSPPLVENNQTRFQQPDATTPPVDRSSK